MPSRLRPQLRRCARASAGAALVGLAAFAGGCGNKIGDPCQTVIDCSIRQDRQCDVSNADRDPDAEGECTIENCVRGGCPKEAVCVKVYATDFASVPCDVEREDLEPGYDDCRAHEICLPDGLCADEIAGRSSCRLECERDADCRDNYECRPLGVDGMYWAPAPDDPKLGGGRSICTPRR